MWTAKANDGAEQRVLVVITTIPLEPHEKGYKKSLVERLGRAAHDYLANSKEASSFVLASRTRDWNAGKAEDAAPSTRSSFALAGHPLRQKAGASHQN